VAAEPREFVGLLPLCSGLRKLHWPVDWARYGECQDRQFWMVANGVGPKNAGFAVDVAHPFCNPAAIVSMGFCGALDPVLGIGDIFVATAVETAGRLFPVCRPVSTVPHRAGVLVSIDRVAQSAAEKKFLSSSGASAVEMEAAGVALRASEYGIPLFCVRSVTDRSYETFAMDFNRALRSDGHFDTIRILTSALRNPWQAFPELIRLRHYCQIATRTLGEFIAGCRF
jgi:adenosylhomocysteine nucleosidase